MRTDDGRNQKPSVSQKDEENKEVVQKRGKVNSFTCPRCF